jgi:hypothetical protein
MLAAANNPAASKPNNFANLERITLAACGARIDQVPSFNYRATPRF